MNKCNFKVVGVVLSAVAFGMFIQIFLPDILIIAICCAIIMVMGILVAKFT